MRELGAFPVAELTKRYWTNGHPGQVYSKGTRIDVEGWVPPYWAASSLYLTDEERRAADLPRAPLARERYLALLDVAAYQEDPDPLAFAVLRITLEELGRHGHRLDDMAVARAIYEVEGLRGYAIEPLGRLLPPAELLELGLEHADDALLRRLVAPGADDTAYATRLEASLTDTTRPASTRVLCGRLLRGRDPERWEPLRELIGAALDAGDVPWRDRQLLYGELVELGDWARCRRGLLEDPVSEVRERLLRQLQAAGVVAEVAAVVRQLAENPAVGGHRPRTPSRAPRQIEARVRRYLTWARDRDGLDEATRGQLDAAEAALSG